MELGADIPGDLLTALRELRVSPKDFVAANYGAFSENLSKFLSSIIFITKPVCDAGEGQLSLSDAAYTLYNSGTIWGKFVDHTAMQCRQLDEMVLATIDDPKGAQSAVFGPLTGGWKFPFAPSPLTFNLLKVLFWLLWPDAWQSIPRISIQRLWRFSCRY